MQLALDGPDEPDTWTHRDEVCCERCLRAGALAGTLGDEPHRVGKSDDSERNEQAVVARRDRSSEPLLEAVVRDEDGNVHQPAVVNLQCGVGALGLGRRVGLGAWCSGRLRVWGAPEQSDEQYARGSGHDQSATLTGRT